jgi:hypothetical protein
VTASGDRVTGRPTVIDHELLADYEKSHTYHGHTPLCDKVIALAQLIWLYFVLSS